MYDMISLHYLCELLHEDDEDKVLRWVKQHKIPTGEWLGQCEIDIYRLLYALRFSADKYRYEYLAEELKIREESVSDILLYYDDMLLQLQKNIKMIPVIHFIFDMMASLISDKKKRKLFLEVSHGVTCADFARRNDINWSEVCNLYDSAFKEIKRKAHRLSTYRNELAAKEKEIRRLKEENFALKFGDKLQKTTIDYEDVMEFDTDEDRLVDLPTLKIRQISDLLSMPVRGSRLNLCIRTSGCLLDARLRTVGDVLKFVKPYGFDQMLKIARFGKGSLKEVKDRFRTLGIIDEQDGCELFDYV